MVISLETLRELLDYNPATGEFFWKKDRGKRVKAGDKAGGVNGSGYIKIRIEGKKYSAGRLAWFYTYGVWPEHEIDHRGCDPSIQKIAELREATRSQNAANRRIFKCNKTGYKGVRKARQKWFAQIGKNGKTYYLGSYATPEEAAEAYKQAALRHHGDFARW